MERVVGIAEMAVSTTPGEVLVTYALGSCLGIAAHDPSIPVGGILHVMLPSSRVNPEKAKVNPFMFVDTGVPEFFRALYAKGAVKERLVIKVAGGASVQQRTSDYFAIGRRNYVLLRKLFWKNNVLIDGEDVGGNISRTMRLEIGTGRVWITNGTRVWDI